jgi:ketosteroid isomerase-like protein
MTEFAKEWIAAWNSHDLERILGHYSGDIVFTSPRAAVRVPGSNGTVRGIEPLRAYWAPDGEIRADLAFKLEQVLETVNGVTILYRDETGRRVAETMLFGPDGKVVRGIVSHGATPSAEVFDG